VSQAGQGPRRAGADDRGTADAAPRQIPSERCVKGWASIDSAEPRKAAAGPSARPARPAVATESEESGATGFDRYPGDDERTIVIKDLAKSVTERDIRDLFKFRGLEKVSLHCPSDQPFQMGFVLMQSAKRAERAIEVLDGSELNGVAIRCKMHQLRPKGPPTQGAEPRKATAGPSADAESDEPGAPGFVFHPGTAPSEAGRTIVIKNIAKSVKELDLEHILKPYGKVVRCRLTTQQGMPRQMAFVVMQFAEDADRAAQRLDEYKLKGVAIRCQMSRQGPHGG